jgi:hypothetical protein
MIPIISAKDIILKIIQFGIFLWLAFIKIKFDSIYLTVIKYFAFLITMALFS